MTVVLRGRRHFLQTLGAGAAVTPLLRPTSVFGQPTAVPKRLVLFVTKNGTWLPDFWPENPGRNHVGSRILQPLEAVRDDVTVLKGIDHAGAMKDPVPPDHRPDFPNLMAGRQPILGSEIGSGGCNLRDRDGRRACRWIRQGPTIDVAIADYHRDNAPAGESNRDLIYLGARGTNNVSFRSESDRNDIENNPFAAYRRLFTRSVLGDAEFARLASRRRGVLDVLREDVATMRCRLGSEHREAFDRHLAAVEQLEQALEGSGCGAPILEEGWNGEGNAWDPDSSARLDDTAAAQFKNLTAAFACDLSRVAVFGLTRGREDFSFLGWNTGGEERWHRLVHQTQEGKRRQPDVSRWIAEQFGRLIQELGEARDADGSRLLDNTLVVWMSEQGQTHNHQRRDMPYVVAGFNKYFRQGRYLDVRRNGESRSNQDLLTMMGQAMGAPFETFGDPDFNRGSLLSSFEA